jgi:hypothetical protein
MIDGRAKGQKFMNQICRAISLWLFPAMDPKTSVYDLPFRTRSTCIMPVEGHWRGEGDILNRPDIDFRLCIEVKKHERWDLDGLLANDKSPIHSWWEQSVEQADKVDMHPLLLFSRNRRKTYCLMRQDTADHLCIPTQTTRPNLVVHQKNQPTRFLCLLDDLLLTDPALAATLK